MKGILTYAYIIRNSVRWNINEQKKFIHLIRIEILWINIAQQSELETVEYNAQSYDKFQQVHQTWSKCNEKKEKPFDSVFHA